MSEQFDSKSTLEERRGFISEVGALALVGAGAMLLPTQTVKAQGTGASTGLYIDVTEYGAVGNGQEDDTESIQRAIDAAAALDGACVVFPKTPPNGYYKTTAPLLLPSFITLKGVGAHQGAPRINNHVSDVFRQRDSNFLKSVTIENLYISAYAGQAFAFNSIIFMRIQRCYVSQNHDNYSIMDISEAPGEMLECVFEENVFVHTLTATVPTFNIVNANGGLNGNTWSCNRFINSGNYCIHLESTAASQYCYDNVIHKITFEVTRGGCVRLLSAYNTEISQCSVWDLGTPPTTKDLFFVGASPVNNTASKYTKFNQIGRRGGILGPALADIRLQSGNKAGLTTIDSCDSASTGFTIDLGNNSRSLLLGLNSLVNVFNATASQTTSIGNDAKIGGKMLAIGGIGVGNAVPATTVGTVSRKIEIFDASGNSLGYLPVYSS